MTFKNQENNAQLCKNEKEITLNILINRFIANPEKEENRLIEYVKNNNVIEFYDVYPWINIKNSIYKHLNSHFYLQKNENDL